MEALNEQKQLIRELMSKRWAKLKCVTTIPIECYLTMHEIFKSYLVFYAALSDLLTIIHFILQSYMTAVNMSKHYNIVKYMLVDGKGHI